MNIPSDIRYIGVNDHQLDLFEGQYILPLGMAYNSYVILDEKIAVMDAVDGAFAQEWLGNLEAALGGRKPDYLVVQHMEPDHSASILPFLQKYPETTVVSHPMSFTMLTNYFGPLNLKKLLVKEGMELPLGKHTLRFVAAPLVHWPEVIMTYETTEQILFSADAFGKFGALDTVDPEGWACEARRYYFGICGKFGMQVSALLKKLEGVPLKAICPLHGPILTEDLDYYLNLYKIWAAYDVESEGIFIAYTSVYGHTRAAVEYLAEALEKRGCPKVAVSDLAREDMAECVEDAFRYGKMVLATTTYCGEIFPFMREFLADLKEHQYQKRTLALIENGSWAPLAAKGMRAALEGLKEITILPEVVTIKGAMTEKNKEELDHLADVLCAL